MSGCRSFQDYFTEDSAGSAARRPTYPSDRSVWSPFVGDDKPDCTPPSTAGPALMRGLATLTLSMCLAWSVTSCGALTAPFQPAVYEGDVHCTVYITDAAGATAHAPVITPVQLTIESNGGIAIDGVEVVEGAEVVRSIPTADLAFEIVEVTHVRRRLTVRYEPRPTLPGIAVEGELVEEYHWRALGIDAAAQANLLIHDVSGTTTLVADCGGRLNRSANP